MFSESVHRNDFSHSSYPHIVEDYSVSITTLVPKSPWETLALPFFIHLFSAASTSLRSEGLLSCIPDLYRQSDPYSPLHLAVSAAADANAAGKLTDQTAIIQARHKHLRALDTIQIALQDHNQALQDTTLCSMFVLTIFEVGSSSGLRLLLTFSVYQRRYDIGPWISYCRI